MKTMIVAAFLTICLAVPFERAQAVDFGLHGGLIFSSISSDDSYDFHVADGEDVNFRIHDDNYTGYHFGAFAEVSLLSFFLQPGLSYTKTGQEMTLRYDSEAGVTRSQDFTAAYSHLKVPLLAGTQFTIARIGVGPVFSVLLDQTDVDFEAFEDSSLDFSNASVGYQLMAGLKYARFTLDYRFEGSFTSLGDNITLGDQSFDFDTRPTQHYISLGILLF